MSVRTATSASPDTDAPAAATRLLGCGVIAGPLFLVVGLAQAFTRDGFDLRRHPFSMLSLGDLGWIQISNFVVCGLLWIACAIGIRRTLHAGIARTAGPAFIGLFGAP
jgi:hypothetical protein